MERVHPSFCSFYRGQQGMVVLYFHPCGIPRWTPSVKHLYVGLDFLAAFSPSLGYNLTHDVIVIHLGDSVPAVVPSALCGGSGHSICS